MKTKAAAQWFAGQSFHSHSPAIMAKVAAMEAARAALPALNLDEQLALVEVGCVVCAAFGRTCCKLEVR